MGALNFGEDETAPLMHSDQKIAARIVIVLGGTLLTLTPLILSFPLEYDLECDRRKGDCTLERKFLVGSRIQKIRIGPIRNAEIRSGEAWLRPRTRVWLVSQGRGGLLIAAYGSSAEAERTARRINAFITDPTSGHAIMAAEVSAALWIAWSLVPALAVLFVALRIWIKSKKGPARP